MFINKIGKYHIDMGINCQDYGFITPDVKCVVDGCSDGLHSEVGAKLFCHLMQSYGYVDKAFWLIINSMSFTPQQIKDYMCFTVLWVVETTESFAVNFCGDGYIITEEIDGTIDFKKLDNGDYPKYFAYNYVGAEHLSSYQDGVSWDCIHFPKSQYKRVGVATDGLRYALDQYYTDEVIEFLRDDKEVKLKRLINKHIPDFKDDITIAW